MSAATTCIAHNVPDSLTRDVQHVLQPNWTVLNLRHFTLCIIKYQSCQIYGSPQWSHDEQSTIISLDQGVGLDSQWPENKHCWNSQNTEPTYPDCQVNLHNHTMTESAREEQMWFWLLTQHHAFKFNGTNFIVARSLPRILCLLHLPSARRSRLLNLIWHSPQFVQTT